MLFRSKMPSKPLVITASFVVEIDFQARSFAVKWVVLAFFRDEVEKDFAFRFVTAETIFKRGQRVFWTRSVVVVSNVGSELSTSVSEILYDSVRYHQSVRIR